MAGETISVKGIVGSAGEWGALYADEEKALPADVAMSLVNAGLASRLMHSTANNAANGGAVEDEGEVEAEAEPEATQPAPRKRRTTSAKHRSVNEK
jgi:hypothetical protein